MVMIRAPPTPSPARNPPPPPPPSPPPSPPICRLPIPASMPVRRDVKRGWESENPPVVEKSLLEVVVLPTREFSRERLSSPPFSLSTRTWPQERERNISRALAHPGPVREERATSAADITPSPVHRQPPMPPARSEVREAAALNNLENMTRPGGGVTILSLCWAPKEASGPPHLRGPPEAKWETIALGTPTGGAAKQWPTSTVAETPSPFPPERKA